MYRYLVPIVLISTVGAQTPAAAPAKPQTNTSRKSAGASSSPINDVISAVKAGLSEPLVIKSLQRANKPYTPTTAELVKLQQAGVSESIINAMMDPAGATAAAPAAVATSAPSGNESDRGKSSSAPSAGIHVMAAAATPFPAPLEGAAGGSKKRRLAVQPFDYSTVRSWVYHWFNTDYNIGEGVRAMLTVRMHQSKNITLLERTDKGMEKMLKEQDFGSTNRVNQGTKAKIGRISGADCMLLGDIVIFGRDDTTKRKGLGSALPGVYGKLAMINKEEKAVVGINLRIVDAETLEVIETAEARGESSRKSKDWGAILNTKGTSTGGGVDMTSSNFEATIIGEATSDAVNKVVAFLEERVPKISAKTRKVEGQVTNISATGVYLTVGANDGVLAGDRFDILKINGEVRDPTTKEVLDYDAVKVGEVVVHNVRDKISIGPYGGEPLSPTYAKGYLARLQ